MTRWRSLGLVLVCWSAGCGSGGGAAPAGHAEPATVSHPVHEDALPVVTLTTEAIARLGVASTPVAEARRGRTRLVGGEVVVPPGRQLMITAPVAGTIEVVHATGLRPGSTVTRGDVLARIVPLAPVDRDVLARAVREVAAARASVATAEARLARQTALVAENASSTRLVEEATMARDIAQADLTVAETRERTMRRSPLASDVSVTVRAPSDGVVRTLAVADRQLVAPGAALFELAGDDALIVRVPVYVGDLDALASSPVTVQRLGASSEAPRFEAHPVAGPPTFEIDRMTVDRYYALDTGAPHAIGERLLVELPLALEEDALVVPSSAVVFDAMGGAWVYVDEGEGAYRRVRIDPIRTDARDGGDGFVVYRRGPALGASVVSTAAAEVFGSEFPPGH